MPVIKLICAWCYSVLRCPKDAQVVSHAVCYGCWYEWTDEGWTDPDPVEDWEHDWFDLGGEG